MPAAPGEYDIRICCPDNAASAADAAAVRVRVRANADTPAGGAAPFLDAIHHALPHAHALRQLPSDYVDVTEGALAPVKRLVKRKLLHNFKYAYVDVLSRQQSRLNETLVQMIQQLAECCTLLDHTVSGMHRRLDELDQRIEKLESAAQPWPQDV